MKKPLITLTAIACVMQIPSASAALIAGSDFSTSAVYNAPGGTYDTSAGGTDDLNLADTVTVSDWSFANGGKFVLRAAGENGIDDAAQVGMPSDNVTKLDGDSQTQPAAGASPIGYASHSFSIGIPVGTVVDLTSVDWVSRQATGSPNTRWIAFNTSLDTNIIYSEVGSIRDNFDTVSVDLTGALYQGLTDQTVTFNWYAGGTGSGDIDFDTPTVNGTVTVPEPSAFALLGFAGLAAFMRRRR